MGHLNRFLEVSLSGFLGWVLWKPTLPDRARPQPNPGCTLQSTIYFSNFHVHPDTSPSCAFPLCLRGYVRGDQGFHSLPASWPLAWSDDFLALLVCRLRGVSHPT